MTVQEALDAYNRLTEHQTKEMYDDLWIIRTYLMDQQKRAKNEAEGFGYLNREADIVERLRKAGLIEG